MSSAPTAETDATVRARARNAARAPALVVLGVLLLQAAWIVTMPPFRGIDEIDHAYRAAAVANGQWRVTESAEDGRRGLVEVPPELVEAAHAQCERQGYAGGDSCSPARMTDDGQVLVASSAAAYPPAFYWLVGSVAAPFEGTGALYAMRIATALLSLFFVACAAWALGRLPTRWPLAGLAVAITPVFAYSTAIVAPNGVEMSAGLALWSSLLALGEPGERRSGALLWSAIAAATVLGGLRVLGPVFTLMIAVTAVILKGPSLLGVARARRRTVGVGAALVVGSIVAQFSWVFDTAVRDLSSDSPSDPTLFSWVNLWVWPLQAIAAFPFRGQAGPFVVYIVVLAVFGAIVGAAWRLGRRRERAAIALSLAAAYGLPFAFTLLTLGSVGSIWQGRYGLAYSVGIVLMATWVLSHRVRATVVQVPLLAPIAVGYAVAVSACLLKVRSRELTGNPASRDDSAWVDLGAPFLGVLSIAAVICLALAVGMKDRAND